MQDRHENLNRLRLEILYGAYVQLDHRWKSPNAKSVYTRLYFIHSGRGYLRRNGQEIELKPGYAYMIPAGCEFSYGCTQMSKLFFHVMLTNVEGLDMLSAVPEICILPCSMQEMEELLRCSQSDDFAQLFQLKTYLFQTITACMQQHALTPMPVRQYSGLVEQAIEHIRRNVSLELSAAGIAKALFVSESRLRKCFREELGMPLGQYIDDLIFLRARQMLMDPTIPISKISQKLGFCDQFYFSRRFKEKHHQTPSEFRKDSIRARF